MKPRAFTLRTDADARSLWAHLRNNWTAMARAGKPLTVTVEESKRSQAQNRAYWRLLNQIADDAWLSGNRYSADCWHEHFKRRFIGIEELPNGGDKGISTTSLTVAEFTDYLEKVYLYAVEELGIQIEV